MSTLKTLAGYGLILSGLLHLPVFLLGGMEVAMLVVTVVYLALGWALIRGLRYLTCATFLIMLFGANVAFGSALSGAAPVWAYWGILAADLFVALCLFGEIWKGRRGAAA